MPNPSHPYTKLPLQAFWKTAVADPDPLEIDLAWKPKFPITRETRIITVGSCFAQHISKSLQKNGFSWVDSEPAPHELPPEEHARQGYGVFSFRTGNIYTAALLKQWIMWATGKVEPSMEVFHDEGRYFDPFRPSLTAEGFPSAEEMLAARQNTLVAMLEAIKQADLFVFTLGLTEAWLNKNGPVYPMCPGTIRGTFSAEDHVFHNYNDQETVRDLADAFDQLRTINPNLRFLLTVSPVPLTATASGQHVLTATTYSKSVLRSAAGYLAQTRADTDYFPSYELITAPVFRGQFYEQNMRSVSPEGVAFVMTQFFGAIEAAARADTPEIPPDSKVAVSAGPAKMGSGADICDDIILETWSNKPVDESKQPPNILLIGDSQMGMIAKVLDEQGIRYAGGAIMHGSEWHDCGFKDDEDTYFLPDEGAARDRWLQCYTESISRYSLASDVTIITNIGAHSFRVFGEEFEDYLGKISPVRFSNIISDSNLTNFLTNVRNSHVNLVKRFVDDGYKVIWVSDPPFQPNPADIFGRMDKVLADRLLSIGCRVFPARGWLQSFGRLPPEFRSSEINPATGELDWVHGSTEYYRQLTNEIFNRFNIKPQYHQVNSDIAFVQKATITTEPEKTESGTDICDDIILETWSNKPVDDLEEPPNILLIGDSQMGMIAKVLDEQGIRYAGGAIMNGSEWDANSFTISDERIFVPFDADAKARWDSSYSRTLGAEKVGANYKPSIICNIGAHPHRLLVDKIGLKDYFAKRNEALPNVIDIADFLDFLQAARGTHISLVEKFVRLGYPVIWISDPPFQPENTGLFSGFDSIMQKILEQIGCSVFNARDWVQTIGGSPVELGFTNSEDWIHGSEEYYRQLTKEIINLFSIKPQYH